MKRRLMLAAMSLILTVTLSVTSMNTVAEASPKMSPTEENLEITINSFLESDGAVAEELTDEMLKTFLETPLDFLRVIDTYPLDKQELLLSRIANVAVGMPDEERLSFEDIIYSADETTPGISLLETYYSEALEATPPQNSVSNLPKYDMESVNQIVKAYLASDSEGNEAFYNYLSNVYAIDVPAIQKYGRTDAMWIHGGRSQTVLQWTDGCVRVFDSSMLSMQNSITEMTRAANGHYQTGSVVYRES